MSTTTIRPDSTTTFTGALTGAATAHAALNDGSDSSYIDLDTGESWEGTLADTSVPAGALIKRVDLATRTVASPPGALLLESLSDGSGTIYSTTLTHSWTAKTDVFVNAGNPTDARLDGASLLFTKTGGAAASIRIYDAYVWVKYVEEPTSSPVSPVPSSTVTDTNLPLVEWNVSLDADGGPQTFYQVKVFSDAQYLAGGFDPVTSTPVTGVVGGGADSSWQVDEILPDDTYRVYVRVAQTVNGFVFLGPWDYSEFVIDVALPADPTVTAAPDNANARIEITVETNTGDATADYIEIERSLDGGTTWEPVRQLQEGMLTPVSGEVTIYDYEAHNGQEAQYRARTLHDYSGVFAGSSWLADNATWTSASWWLKHPLQPDMNIAVRVRSQPALTRAGRQGVFQPLGSSTAVVVQDTRAPSTGAVTLRVDTVEERAALDALIEEYATLLLQGTDGDGDGPGYIRVLNHERQRVIDHTIGGEMRWDALEFVVVPAPSGDVVEWPP